MNRVESLQTDSQDNWKILSMNNKIAKCFHLAAASFEGRIVVFGGRSYATKHTYIFDEEGELIEDLSSDDELIPEKRSCGWFVVRDGKIFAGGDTTEWSCALKSFDGVKWSLV